MSDDVMTLMNSGNISVKQLLSGADAAVLKSSALKECYVTSVPSSWFAVPRYITWHVPYCYIVHYSLNAELLKNIQLSHLEVLAYRALFMVAPTLIATEMFSWGTA